MHNIFKALKKRINGVIFALIINGIVLILLAILILWNEVLLRVFVALMILSVSWVFFYLAYKIWAFKRDIEKYLRL